MNEAATTWALVVGIDEYADPAIQDLDGAVADAVAFSDWLNRIGVPEAQIMLHAVPGRRSRRLLKGRTFADTDPASIDRSIVRLEKVPDGTRLFVYLAGHGVYEPTAQRLFLLDKFTVDTPINLGLEKHVARFLAMRFARQFLFVDGCQNLPYSPNERQAIEGQMFGGRTGFTARPGNVLIGCYAASQGELASELNGHGVFTRRLLEAIDPESPFDDAIVLDFSNGERRLDLRKAVTGYVRPSVQEDVAGRSPQTPNLEAEAGETEDVCALYTFCDESPPGRVTVTIKPKTAHSAVERLRISVLDHGLWNYALPQPPARKVGVPFEVRIPAGCRAAAYCVLQKGAVWAGTVERLFTIHDETALEFALERARPAGAPQEVEVRTVDEAGSTVANQFSYAEVAGAGLAVPAYGGSLAPSVRFQHREIGPVFVTRGGSARGLGALIASRRFAADWAKVLLDATPEGVGVATIATARPAEALRPRLRLTLPRGGAKALAGPIADRKLLWVGYPEDAPVTPLYETPVGAGPEGARSLDSLKANPIIEVEPGHVLVRLDLPWGSWSKTVSATPADVTEVELPSSVGKAPLRVRLARDLGRDGSNLLAANGREPVVTLRDGLWGGRTAKFRPVRPRVARWALASPRAGWVKDADIVPIATTGSFSFPYLYGRSLGLERVASELQVEPLSTVDSTAWDVLLVGGLLDALPSDTAVELTFRKWEDSLLGLAGAYAVYALPPNSGTNGDLDLVLGNLAKLARRPNGRRVPDIDLLRAALRVRRDQPLKPDERAALEGWAARGAVPILRWGIALAIGLVGDGVVAGDAVERWRKELEALERTLSPSSVWTVWRSRR